MQFTITTIVTLLAAAASAAPGTFTARQSGGTFTELATFSDNSCQDNRRTGTVNLVDASGCQNLPAGIFSAKVDIDVPAGCNIQFFFGSGCTSVNTIVLPRDITSHQCFQFGSGRQVGSYIASGTCALS
ncbi:hypothetical protein B0J11DRAFT_320429 [Dendryphion nanum]|uniref:Uncharacterized protein n=1 Tax=Dendryphion nanum TaxID=256645 RepID=A0A9P9IIU6_9PLEO|nr:hypothetical protein B0J11DRAFT_320429 [Dendryphion nanum]